MSSMTAVRCCGFGRENFQLADFALETGYLQCAYHDARGIWIFKKNNPGSILDIDYVRKARLQR